MRPGAVRFFRFRARRGRGLWGICAGLIAITFVVAALAASAVRQVIRAAERQEVRALGTAVAGETSRYVQVVVLSLGTVQDALEDGQALTSAGFDRMAASRSMYLTLHRIAGNLLRADTLFLLNRSGELLNMSRAHPPPVADLSDRTYFRRLRAPGAPRVVFSRPLISRVAHIPVIVVARRLTAPDGTFLGVAGAMISIRQLHGFYATVAGVGGQTITLLRRDGERIVTWPAPNRPPAIMPAGSPWYALAAASGGLYHASDRLVSVHPLAEYPLVVNVGLTDAQALARANEQAGLVWLAAVVVAAGLVVLFFIIVRQFENLEARNRDLSRTADRLGRSERRFQDFARTASDGFWEVDATLRFSAVGPEPDGADDLFGAYTGRLASDVVDAERNPEAWARIQASVAARRPFRDIHYARVTAQGLTRHFSASGTPVQDQAGGFAGYRGTVREISAQHAAEADLRAAKERAEHAEALLGDAVDAISEGFVIFDRDDRFVMCNKSYRDLHALELASAAPGIRFETILRGRLARGGIVDALGREGAWLEERLRQHQAATGALEQTLTDGRTVLITERRMRDGGIAGLRIDITDLKRTQAALRASEERLDRAQEIARIGSWEFEIATGRYVWSKQLYRIRGLSEAAFVATAESLAAYTEDPDLICDWLTRLAVERDSGALEYAIVLPDGRKRLIRDEGRALVDPDGQVRRLSGTVQDITEQRLIEQQLAQARKMQAVGNLTGGISHDFNNLLGVIIGNLQLLQEQIADRPEARELCGEALAAGRRGADLTRRLLAFARRQPLAPRATDINALIGESAKLLRRVLRADIAITLDLAPDLRPIAVDPGQLEAALTNLATNAADAMPEGGRLTIATAAAALDAAYAARHAEVVPGCYTSITVSDTGTGMAPEVMAHVFEPFFTTKPPGQGTGLGLSMVFGFVKQSGGHVSVYSEPGRGTIFRLYLRADPTRAPAPLPPPVPAVRGGTETVLLAEDDPLLRRTLARQLAGLGYALVEAGSAAEALAVLDAGREIDLVLSDVVMPGPLDGLDLADRIDRDHPAVRLLLMSGFPEARSSTYAGSTLRFRLISKPFDRDQLAVAVRAVLDAGKGAADHKADGDA